MDKALISYLENELSELSFPEKPKDLYEPIRYILKLGGKRIRPVLTLLSCQLFGGANKDALNQALAVEVFHNFSLMHDDIMDKAPLRRGKETVHKKWNDSVAILSGDAMLILSYQCLARESGNHLAALLDCFNKTALDVCDGQQFDMEFEEREDVSPDEYLKMISLKTAALLSGALELGAIQADANQDQIDSIGAFGYHLGMAFQLQDDLLDAFGDPKTFGKQVGGDILANKKTILYFSALQSDKQELKDELWKLFHEDKLQGEEKIKKCLSLFENMGAKDKVEYLKEEHFQKANAALLSCNGNKEIEASLLSIAEALQIRVT